MLDFFFEFASTYSYPAALRIGAVARTAGVTVRWRPFLLGPIFRTQGYDTSPFNVHEAKGRYMWRDLARTCENLGLPFRRPEPFPQNGLLAARVAYVGLDEDWGEAFCRAVFTAEFGQGLEIGSEAVIRDLLVGLAQQPDAILARARSDEIKTRLRATTEEAQRLGIFGAPNFVVGDELFWGNDRLEQAICYAVRRNTSERS
ncbi:MAG TPA: 2-hydroxychromene-2-carboxylate isomerase [Xanthobacteraceae bacterium]|nr:2-hydroxychromene-2-carboxylate isomerase [Xanthobacteraceae bacterium]